MKTLKLTAALAAIATLGLAPARAAQTNLVETLQIQLVAYTQGPTTTTPAKVKKHAQTASNDIIFRTINPTFLASKDVIQLLGAATGHDFSIGALLEVVKTLPDGEPIIRVRDGDTSVDVTKFFVQQFDPTSVEASRLDPATGITSGTKYGLLTFSLQDPGVQPEAIVSQSLTTHFTVSGLTRTTFISLLNGDGQVMGRADEYSAIVAGKGDVGGIDTIFQGMIILKGRRIEIVNPD